MPKSKNPGSSVVRPSLQLPWITSLFPAHQATDLVGILLFLVKDREQFAHIDIFLFDVFFVLKNVLFCNVFVFCLILFGVVLPILIDCWSSTVSKLWLSPWVRLHS